MQHLRINTIILHENHYVKDFAKKLVVCSKYNSLKLIRSPQPVTERSERIGEEAEYHLFVHIATFTLIHIYMRYF